MLKSDRQNGTCYLKTNNLQLKDRTVKRTVRVCDENMLIVGQWSLNSDAVFSMWCSIIYTSLLFNAPKTFCWHKVDDGRTPTCLKAYWNIRSINNSNNPNMFATKAVVLVPRRSNRSMWGRLNPTNHVTIFFTGDPISLGESGRILPVPDYGSNTRNDKTLAGVWENPNRAPQPDVSSHFKKLQGFRTFCISYVDFGKTYHNIHNNAQ